jgi:hypothetical protein
VPKASVGRDAKTAVGPFGSVFFSNLCRMTWQVKKHVGTNENLVRVGLIPEKQHDGARVLPLGLEFFTPDRITVRKVDLASVAGLADRVPLSVRMAHTLKRGPMTLAPLSEELGAKLDSVIKASKRSDAFTKVRGQDGITRLALVDGRIA